MWDQLRERSSKLLIRRIIPTYVGSTSQAQTRAAGASNHSHVCGINGDTFVDVSATCESFPRMWDQPGLSIVLTGNVRIIPTYVGSTA